MITTATEMKNNFGHYLKQVIDLHSEVIITKNNQKVACLIPYNHTYDQTIGDDRHFTLNDAAADYIYDRKTVSYDEFMRIYERSDSRMEYINGEIWLMTSPGMNHQKILGDLYVLFRKYFEGKPCKPFLAPFDVHFRKIDVDVPDVMQPDLLVIGDFEGHIDEQDKYMGTPALVLEILSDSTRSKDMVYKLNTYLSSGVGEYWIVDPKSKTILLYEFVDHAIERFTQYKEGEVVFSGKFEGLSVNVSELFADWM